MNNKITISHIELVEEKSKVVEWTLGEFISCVSQEVTNVSELVNIARAVTKAHDEFLEAEGLATGENA